MEEGSSGDVEDLLIEMTRAHAPLYQTSRWVPPYTRACTLGETVRHEAIDPGGANGLRDIIAAGVVAREHGDGATSAPRTETRAVAHYSDELRVLRVLELQGSGGAIEGLLNDSSYFSVVRQRSGTNGNDENAVRRLARAGNSEAEVVTLAGRTRKVKCES